MVKGKKPREQLQKEPIEGREVFFESGYLKKEKKRKNGKISLYSDFRQGIRPEKGIFKMVGGRWNFMVLW